MTNRLEQFTIEWVDIGARPEIAERFWCAGHTGCLPFLVAPDESPADGTPLACNEFMLAGGLLYTWGDSPVNTPLVYESVRTKQLAELSKGFGFVDIEGLITGYAHRMRILYGHETSFRMLRNGRALLHNSSPIAADLSLDLGYILSKSALPECKPLVQELLDAISNVDESETEPKIWQHLLVFRLAALKLIGDQIAVTKHLDTALKGKIDSPDLQVAVNRLSNMTGRDVAEAFQPGEWSGLSVQAMEDHECDH